MKKYYVLYGDFANSYSLRYAENDEQEKTLEQKGYEKVTRAEAISLARKEAERRNDNPNFSGYADQYIYPCNHIGNHFEKREGYIVIR